MTEGRPYDEMSDEQRARCDQAMSVFTDWLNSWHSDLKETWTNDAGETVPVRVTKESYFEFDDSPRVLLDAELAPTEYRIMVFLFNPYHDEGGPNEMTCYFDRPDSSASDAWRIEQIDLRHMDQLFDTMIQPVWEQGKFVSGPLEGTEGSTVRDVTAEVNEGRK